MFWYELSEGGFLSIGLGLGAWRCLDVRLGGLDILRKKVIICLVVSLTLLGLWVLGIWGKSLGIVKARSELPTVICSAYIKRRANVETPLPRLR